MADEAKTRMNPMIFSSVYAGLLRWVRFIWAVNAEDPYKVGWPVSRVNQYKKGEISPLARQSSSYEQSPSRWANK